MNTIERASMIHRWERLAFVHWAYPAESIRVLLPDGLEVDTFDGIGWVGLLPFDCRVRLPGTPFMPWASTFHEINVRTYVRGPEGPGIWFFSLDAARFGAVVGARKGAYRLPYMWAKMHTKLEGRSASTGGDGGRIRYESERRWPGPTGTHCRLELAIGVGVAAEDTSARERFLMERYRLYSPDPHPGMIATAEVDHEPWQIRRARIIELDQNLLEAAGLPEPEGSPLAAYSPGVQTRFGKRRVLPLDGVASRWPSEQAARLASPPV